MSGPCRGAGCRYWIDDQHGCALRHASQGISTLDKIGEMMGITSERVRQIQVSAIKKMLAAAEEMGISALDLPQAPALTHWELLGFRWGRGELTPEDQQARQRSTRERDNARRRQRRAWAREAEEAGTEAAG